MEKIVYLFFILFLFAQCKDEMSGAEKRQAADERKISAYLTKHKIQAKEYAAGIYYQKLKEVSSGETIQRGDIVYAKCAVSVLNGDTLVANTDTLVAFEHQTRSLIPRGLDIGCNLMKKGEKFRFYLPSVAAFKWYSNSRVKLRPHSILICDLDVVQVQSKQEKLAIEKDSIAAYLKREKIEQAREYPSGLCFKKLTTKNSGRCLRNGDFVRMHFERKYLDGSIHFSTFKNNPVAFRLGTGHAVKGLEEGLRLLKPGESALLIMPSSIAFGASTQVIPHELRKELIIDKVIHNTPEPFSPVVYKVEVLR